jgi:hypothetical protein
MVNIRTIEYLPMTGSRVKRIWIFMFMTDTRTLLLMTDKATHFSMTGTRISLFMTGMDISVHDTKRDISFHDRCKNYMNISGY